MVNTLASVFADVSPPSLLLSTVVFGAQAATESKRLEARNSAQIFLSFILFLLCFVKQISDIYLPADRTKFHRCKWSSCFRSVDHREPDCRSDPRK